MEFQFLLKHLSILMSLYGVKASCETGEQSGFCREGGYLGNAAKKETKISNTKKFKYILIYVFVVICLAFQKNSRLAGFLANSKFLS